jgi:hypothetical protein
MIHQNNEGESTMRTFKVNMSAKADGTSLRGYVQASYADLAGLFGSKTISDDNKVSTEWKFTANDGRTVTLYDYKETNLYDRGLPSVEEFRALSSYDWHIGAIDEATADEFKLWLQAILRAP